MQEARDKVESPYMPLAHWERLGFDPALVVANCPKESHSQGLGDTYQVCLHSEVALSISQKVAEETLKIDLKARKRSSQAALKNKPAALALQDKPAEEAEGFSAAEQAELEEALNDLSEDEEDAQMAKDAAKAQSKEQKRLANKQKKEDQKQQKLQEQKQKKRNRELHALANKANRNLVAPLAKLQKAKDMAGESQAVSDMVRESVCSAHQQLVQWHSAALALVLKAAKNPSAKLDELPFASFQDLDAQVKEYLALAETVKTKAPAGKAGKKTKAKAKATAKATTRKRKAEQLEEDLEGDADQEKNGEDADESKNGEDSEETPFEVEPAD